MFTANALSQAAPHCSHTATVDRFLCGTQRGVRALRSPTNPAIHQCTHLSISHLDDRPQPNLRPPLPLLPPSWLPLPREEDCEWTLSSAWLWLVLLTDWGEAAAKPASDLVDGTEASSGRAPAGGDSARVSPPPPASTLSGEMAW